MGKNTDQIHIELRIPAAEAGNRLDTALSHLLPDYSRSRIQSWIKQHDVTVNQAARRAKDKVEENDAIIIDTTLPQANDFIAEDIPLNIVYQDDDIIVINKPAGLVAHPACGNWQGTLLNALLHHIPTLAQLPRAGLIHRLDKGTSGLLVIAKHLKAHTHLVKQLQDRQFKRIYYALVTGNVVSGGTINAPISRHPKKRTHMAVVASGKEAITHYRVVERFDNYTLLKVQLETGRTHQIRVHMAHIHFPIVGDPIYGGRLKLPSHASQTLTDALCTLKHQALHAHTLGLKHPLTGKYLEWDVPIPTDITSILSLLAPKDKQHG